MSAHYTTCTDSDAVGLLASAEGSLRVRRTSPVASDLIGHAVDPTTVEAAVVELRPELRALADDLQRPTGPRLLSAAGSVRAVARTVGVTPMTAHRWMKGLKAPSAAARVKIEAAYGIQQAAWPALRERKTVTGCRKKACACGAEIHGKGRKCASCALQCTLTCMVCGALLDNERAWKVRSRGARCMCGPHAREAAREAKLKPRPACIDCGAELRRTKAALAGKQRCRNCHDLARLAQEVLCIDCGAPVSGSHRDAKRCGDCARVESGRRSASMTPEQRAVVAAKVREAAVARARQRPPREPCVACGGEVKKKTAKMCGACSRRAPRAAGRQLTEEQRARISEGMRKAWQRPEYQEARAAGFEAIGRQRRSASARGCL